MCILLFSIFPIDYVSKAPDLRVTDSDSHNNFYLGAAIALSRLYAHRHSFRQFSFAKNVFIKFEKSENVADFPTIDNSSNSTSITLNWTQEDPHNQINYLITYQVLPHIPNWCEPPEKYFSGQRSLPRRNPQPETDQIQRFPDDQIQRNNNKQSGTVHQIQHHLLEHAPRERETNLHNDARVRY
jgi:hypothetical protein